MRRRIEIRTRRNRTPKSDGSFLDEVVAPMIFEAMRTASVQLTRRGIRHALMGARAVGADDDPRAARGVGYRVGDEAFAGE